MENKRLIKIPASIKLKTEFFNGYGMEELIKTLIVGGISVVVAYLIYSITHQTLIPTLFVMMTITLSAVVLTKNTSNFSMLDYAKNIVKFLLIQKEYRYERGGFNK